MDENIISGLLAERKYLSAEIRTLKSKLKAIEATLKSYRVARPISGKRRPNRKPKPETIAIHQVVRDALLEAGGGPLLIRQLAQKVTQAGIHVSGKNKRSTISAALSYSDEFESRGGEIGWVLAHRPEDGAKPLRPKP